MTIKITNELNKPEPTYGQEINNTLSFFNILQKLYIYTYIYIYIYTHKVVR